MTGTGFWWILLACALYGALHSLLAARKVKRLAAARFGQAAFDRYYRLFFVGVVSITALPLPVLVWLLPDRSIYNIPSPWVFLTLLIQALAGVALLAGVMQTGAMRFLGIQQLFAPESDPAVAETLVTGGLYRWVRHPLYTASLLIIWLTPVMTWNVLALLLGLTGYLLVGMIFEERKLVEQFGQKYEEYRRRTPRIIPWLRHDRKRGQEW